jgi:hypothetical protein
MVKISHLPSGEMATSGAVTSVVSNSMVRQSEEDSLRLHHTSPPTNRYGCKQHLSVVDGLVVGRASYGASRAAAAARETTLGQAMSPQDAISSQMSNLFLRDIRSGLGSFSTRLRQNGDAPA